MRPFSVVVVTHDSASELRSLLDSLERHLDEPPQTVVADAASQDGTLALAEGRAEVVALDENRGFGATCNAGVARASCEVTVILNPDVELLDAGLAGLAGRARGREAL